MNEFLLSLQKMKSVSPALVYLFVFLGSKHFFSFRFFVTSNPGVLFFDLEQFRVLQMAPHHAFLAKN